MAAHSRIALLDDERFDAHRAPEGHHPERPERLEAARAGVRSGLGDGAPVAIAPRLVNEEEVRRVHAAGYLGGLREALAEGHGALDGDTYFCAGTREATELAAGGVVALVETLMTSETRRGIALVRPPGHHARPGRPMGFCLLNNVAIAAAAALARGAQRVAIVDWDVHHGNGTQEMFYDDPRVLFISLHQWPCYPGTGAAQETGRGAGQGTTLNIPLPAGADPAVFGAAFRRLVIPALQAFRADVVLVSAGFDAHERDPLANLNLDAATYGAMTSALVDHVEGLRHGRLGLVLEGGYDLRALEDSVAAVTRALGGSGVALPEGRIGPEFERALARAEALR
ncbi:MAG: histone deacetylase [Sandaracinaceae bacterium]|nr:histone deacetylase [Sandaracinaceae bacterium]